MQIGHIQDILQIPPEYLDLELCDICEVKPAIMLFEMNEHSEDMQCCKGCAEKALQINRMIDMMEN